MITTFDNVDTFPNLIEQETVACKKAKGVNRVTQQQELTYHDFENVAVHNHPSRKVIVATIKKVNFKLYLVRSKKRLLTNFTSKRLFSPKFRRSKHFFSFPLHLLKIVEQK